MIAALLVAQATVLSPPVGNSRVKSGTDWARTVQASGPVPSGTIDHPTLIADAEIGSPESTIGYARQSQAAAAREGARTMVPPIASIASPGCRKVADHPYGHALAAARMLNGRATIFQCTDFVVRIGVRDFTQPLKLGTAAGFPESATKAVLNGGALTHWYRQSASGIRQAVFIWVGKTQVVDIGLGSRDASLAALSDAGNRIVDGLTRGR